MSKEILVSPEELRKERGTLESKVADIQAKKNKDIADRILDLDTRRDETGKLAGLLKEAEENVDYYKKLEELGQLPGDELANMVKAEELVLQIKAKMAEHDEAVKSNMAIPEVKDKVMEEAQGINQRYNEKENEKQKEKMIAEKLLQWFEKLDNMVEELNKKQTEELANRNEAASNLIKKVDLSITNETVKKELEDKLRNIYGNIQNFQDRVAQYRRGLGLSKFFEKIKVNSLINSSEFKEMEKATERFNKFIEETKLEGWAGRDSHGCMMAILDNNVGGLADELKDLYNLSFKGPFVRFSPQFEKAYKKVDFSKKTSFSPSKMEYRIIEVIK